jgi:hypothetical protein
MRSAPTASLDDRLPSALPHVPSAAIGGCGDRAPARPDRCKWTGPSAGRAGLLILTPTGVGMIVGAGHLGAGGPDVGIYDGIGREATISTASRSESTVETRSQSGSGRIIPQC